MSHAERSDSSAEKGLVSPRVDGFLHQVFLAIDSAGKLHRLNPYYLVTGAELIASGGLAHYVLLLFMRPLMTHYHLEHWELSSSVAADIIAHLVLTGVLYVVLSTLAQMVAIARRGVASREIGLTWMSERGDIQSLLTYYLRNHPETDPIRVICISGSGLFGCRTEGGDTPLREWAGRGRLDVIMPASNKSNPTIHERFRRYSPLTKKANYRDVQELIAEVDRGKAFLKEEENEVTEHNVLCMWRVIILQTYCLVQSYFPNITGTMIEAAPVVVYQKTGKNSYYHTYVDMFELLKKHAKRGF